MHGYCHKYTCKWEVSLYTYKDVLLRRSVRVMMAKWSLLRIRDNWPKVVVVRSIYKISIKHIVKICSHVTMINDTCNYN